MGQNELKKFRNVNKSIEYKIWIRLTGGDLHLNQKVDSDWKWPYEFAADEEKTRRIYEDLMIKV